MKSCPREQPWGRVKPVGRVFRRKVLSKCGRAAFLLPDPEKPQFPLVPKGSCCISARGLNSALNRAAQKHYPPEIMRRGLEIAKRAGVPAKVIERKTELLEDQWDTYRRRALKRWRAGGYKRILKIAGVKRRAGI